MSADTASLVANARQQIARLLTQLADLEDAREVRATTRRSATTDGRTTMRWMDCRLTTTTTTTTQEFDDEEYAETKAATLTQLDAFKTSLRRMTTGDVTLEDELATVKAATKAAIASAFRTPEVLKMFALRQPDELRERMQRAARDVMLGKMSAERGDVIRVEALTALKKLGSALEAEELEFLRAHMTRGLTDFVDAAE